MGVWTWSVCVVCLWVILLSVRSGVWENLASNVKYCFTSTSAESNDFSGYSLKTYTGYKETDAMCNLLLFVFFPNCTSLYLFLCEHDTACACVNRNMLHHNQPARSHFNQRNPGPYISSDAHKNTNAPSNVAACVFKCLHTQIEKNATKQTHRKMYASPSSLVSVAADWSAWWRFSAGNWVQRTGPCMVKWCRPSFLSPYERLFWGILNSPTQAQQFWG